MIEELKERIKSCYKGVIKPESVEKTKAHIQEIEIEKCLKIHTVNTFQWTIIFNSRTKKLSLCLYFEVYNLKLSFISV